MKYTQLAAPMVNVPIVSGFTTWNAEINSSTDVSIVTTISIAKVAKHPGIKTARINLLPLERTYILIETEKN